MIVIIALCPYALFKVPVFLLIDLLQNLQWVKINSGALPPLHLDHAIHGSVVIALYNVHAIFK